MGLSLRSCRRSPGFLLGIIREAWRNDREKLGVLRLILAEIRHNAEVVRTIEERGRDLIASSDFHSSMRMDTWRDVRKTAARLLPDNLRQALNDYYSPLQTLLTLLQFENHVNDRADRGLREAIKAQVPQKEVALTRNPYHEYRDSVLQAQEEAQKRIEEYLELSWWRRWFGRGEEDQ
jgi:hypothetical protein